MRYSPGMRVEILCTGDEILTGKTINTNYSHMARRLGDVGLTVHWGTTVGDDRESLLQAFRQAGERADAVIVNGGLGPTVDDLSQEVAAEASGVKLVLSDYWMTRMEQSYARRGRVMPPNNKKQAMLPENAEFIDNPIGTSTTVPWTVTPARCAAAPPASAITQICTPIRDRTTCARYREVLSLCDPCATRVSSVTPIVAGHFCAMQITGASNLGARGIR
jgi:nicotinamide-nucleotide amidase